MSKINKVKVNDISYDIEDTSVGDLTGLNTTDKTNLVNAINEVFNGLSNAGGGSSSLPTIESDTNPRSIEAGVYRSNITAELRCANSGTQYLKFEKNNIYIITNTFNTRRLIIWFNSSGSTIMLNVFQCYSGTWNEFFLTSFLTDSSLKKSTAGYDETKTQVLKSINGTLTWVTE